MDARDLAELIDTCGAALTLCARQYCDAPEDAVQTAFLKLARLRHPPDYARAWLFTTVRRCALDLRRGESRRKRRESAAAQGRWFEPSSRGPSDASDAEAMLRTLPVEQREVIVMRLWSGLTLEEIAAAYGCSVSSAHRRYEAGLAALRERMIPT